MINVVHETGPVVEFDCPATIESVWTNRAILEGRTYPHLPFLTDVRTIVDAGANCGGAAVYFAMHHPRSTVHCFEPGREALGYLERNVAALPGAVVHPFGLFDHDRTATLRLDPDDLGRSSVVSDASDTGGSAVVTETVELRAAGPWARSEGIERIDILKVDVEGCEVAVLTSLAEYLPTVQAIYVEYDTRAARREIDRMLAATHELYYAALLALDQGEVLYLHKDLADHPDARPRLREIFTRPPAAT